MIPKLFAAVLMVAAPLVAQHEGHQTDGSAPPSTAAEIGKSGGMMCEQMMAKKEADQDAAAKLAAQLADNVAAMEKETLPAGAKEKLAAQADLVKQLQDKLAEKPGMMGGKMGQKAGTDKK